MLQKTITFKKIFQSLFFTYCKVHPATKYFPLHLLLDLSNVGTLVIFHPFLIEILRFLLDLPSSNQIERSIFVYKILQVESVGTQKHVSTI